MENCALYIIISTFTAAEKSYYSSKMANRLAACIMAGLLLTDVYTV